MDEEMLGVAVALLMRRLVQVEREEGSDKRNLSSEVQ